MKAMLLPQEAINFLKSDEGSLFREDVIAWTAWQCAQEWYKTHWYGHEDLSDLEYHSNKLFFTFEEFRSLFDYRVPQCRGALYEQFRRATDLNINCSSIGPRFLIEHGYSTVILAREIGSDFKIGHNVTVGFHRGVPKIADRVHIRTGAVVIGNIQIGNDCQIMANAVVSQDMNDGMRAYAARTNFI